MTWVVTLILFSAERSKMVRVSGPKVVSASDFFSFGTVEPAADLAISPSAITDVDLEVGSGNDSADTDEIKIRVSHWRGIGTANGQRGLHGIRGCNVHARVIRRGYIDIRGRRVRGAGFNEQSRAVGLVRSRAAWQV